VVIGGNAYTRRRAFGTAGAVLLGVTALSGCGLFDDDEDERKKKAADPLQPLLAEALALAAAYDRAAVGQPGLSARLAPLAADHRAHATELARVVGEPAPSAVPSASAPAAVDDAAGSLATLRKAEQAAQKTAAAACRQAPAGRAALIGSIAACRATHAEALR
jgi:hypothetical protein